jgi:hypothetical protein
LGLEKVSLDRSEDSELVLSIAYSPTLDRGGVFFNKIKQIEQRRGQVDALKLQNFWSYAHETARQEVGGKFGNPGGERC